MYSLRLTCKPDEVDLLAAELLDAGTIGIRETEEHGETVLVAGFVTNDCRRELLQKFAPHSPEWLLEPVTDWAAVSRAAWPARVVGERFFLAPPWSDEITPEKRVRLVHTPGSACGTGEHPCTQLALMALEKCVFPGCTVADIGTGSGLLAIASLRLGAARAIGIDLDFAALEAARDNFDLNGLRAELVCGSADSLASDSAAVTVANISGTVLLAIWEHLARITRQSGFLIVTGFPQSEAMFFKGLLPNARAIERDGWCCLTASLGHTMGGKGPRPGRRR
jgi:ribosomal protein L11 methyltransferase